MNTKLTDKQIEGLADAIIWAQQTVEHRSRSNKEIQYLTTLLAAVEDWLEEPNAN